jgi:hypothetical protein
MIIFLGSATVLKAQAEFDRVAFYEAMSKKNLDQVNGQLAIVSKSSMEQKQAFEGALIMKKAGLLSGAGKKLNTFKDGHKKLEASLQKDSGNAEYRFLRLMIQENAPGILGYKDDLKKDSEYLRKNFKSLPQEAKNAVIDYSKNSKILRSADFN